MKIEKIPVLFTNVISNYNNDNRFEPYNINNDAMNFNDNRPLIAHPPCRLWSKLKGLSTAPQHERGLAYHALYLVYKNGGILEHPYPSDLWNQTGLLTTKLKKNHILLKINQGNFGLEIRKPTLLFINGLTHNQLPDYPFMENPKIYQKIENLKKDKRSETPPQLIEFFYSIMQIIINNKSNQINL